METGRNNDDGISGRQLRELLRSLPAAHAPEDLELNLLYRINEEERYPHRNRLRRFPRARTRTVASQSARSTRGIDRMRGLAAAAFAAFIVVGGWTFLSESAPLQSAAVATQSQPAPAVTQTSPPASAQPSAIESAQSQQPATAPATSGASTGSPGYILSPIELEWSEETAEIPTKPSSNKASITQEKMTARTAPAASTPPTGVARPQSSSKASSTPSKVPSPTKGSPAAQRSLSPADSIPVISQPADTPNIGTGGEPAEKFDNE